MRLPNKSLETLKSIDESSSRQSQDLSSVKDSPLSVPALVDFFKNATEDLDDLSAAVEKCLNEIQKRLLELQHQPNLYWQARTIAYQVMADRWLFLASVHNSDPDMAQKLMDLATQAEGMALKLNAQSNGSQGFRATSNSLSTGNLARRMQLGI